MNATIDFTEGDGEPSETNPIMGRLLIRNNEFIPIGPTEYIRKRTNEMARIILAKHTIQCLSKPA